MNLIKPRAVEVINRIIELAKKRNDTKLFSWKETRLPNKILMRSELKMGIKIKGRGLHGFRRGFADRLFAIGLSIPEVQEIMRHRDINITIAHYRSTNQKELIEKMTEKL